MGATALLALADTAAQVRWNGDMRHLPSVGATLTPPGTSPYLVVKQDNNGTTFVAADSELSLPADLVEVRAEIHQRRIAAWTHPTLAEIDATTIDHQRIDATPPNPAHCVDDPPF